MVFSCCVSGCTTKYSKDKKVTLHRFPQNEKLRKKWAKFVNIRKPKSECFGTQNRICGLHFNENDYKNYLKYKFGGSSCLYLKDDAVPSKQSVNISSNNKDNQRAQRAKRRKLVKQIKREKVKKRTCKVEKSVDTVKSQLSDETAPEPSCLNVQNECSTQGGNAIPTLYPVLCDAQTQTVSSRGLYSRGTQTNNNEPSIDTQTNVASTNTVGVKTGKVKKIIFSTKQNPIRARNLERILQNFQNKKGDSD